MPLLKTESKFFTFLVGFSAVTVAAWAAIFSVTGLSMLYSGSMLYVAFAMGVLEFSKIIIVSYLYRHWKETAWWLRGYLTTALIILMLITSGGIYGYLTNSYQGATIGLDKINSQTQVLEQTKERLYTERDRITGDLERLNTERQQTITNRNDEIASMQINDSTRYYDRIQRQRVYNRYDDEIKRVDESVVKNNVNLDSVNAQISRVEQSIADKKLEMIDTGVEVGPLLYMARIFNTDMDTVMKYFTLVIVMVFDPLAIALILALNVILASKSNVELSPKKSTESKEIDWGKDVGAEILDDYDEPIDLGEPDDISNLDFRKDSDETITNIGKDKPTKERIEDYPELLGFSTVKEGGEPIKEMVIEEQPKKKRFSDDVLKYKPTKEHNEGTEILKQVVDDVEKMSVEEYEDLYDEASSYGFSPIKIADMDDEIEHLTDEESHHIDETISLENEKSEIDEIDETDTDDENTPTKIYNEELQKRTRILSVDEIYDAVEDAKRNALKDEIGKITRINYGVGGEVKVDHSITDEED